MTGLRPTLVKFTVFATVSVLLFVGLFTMMRNTVPGDGTVQWQARFAEVSGLRPGDDVRVAGVELGRVDAVEVVDDDQALVTFTLPEDRPLHASTRLTLRYQNLLGQRYLAITSDGPAGPELAPGTVIPASRTSPGFDLTALLNGFEPLFAVIDPAEVNDLAANIVAVLQGEAGRVESLLARTADATRFLADREQVFTRVLQNLTPVLENLDDQGAELDATVVEFRRLMTGLAGQRRTFARSIDHLGALVAATSDLLEELREPWRRDVAALRRTARTLAREHVLLGETVDLLAPLLSAFARSMSYGGFLNVYLCNLGFAASDVTTWVSGPGGPYSEVCR